MFRKDMRESYNQLYQINEEMVRSYAVRVANHEQLLDALRQINLIIQQAAHLRGIKAGFMHKYLIIIFVYIKT